MPEKSICQLLHEHQKDIIAYVDDGKGGSKEGSYLCMRCNNIIGESQ